jgi:release factor glutamine methyltransferase
MEFERDALFLLHEKYRGRECPEYFVDLKRIECGEPLAYVIGWIDFLECRIDLSCRPLIPRPETEWWVEQAINKITHSNLKPKKVLDIFSGSGCIGIAIAKHFPDTHVTCSDVSRSCVTQITQNAEMNRVSNRVSVVQGDIFSAISGTFEYIFANPPYIDFSLEQTLDRSVTSFEPHEALFAVDGIQFIRTVINEADSYLVPGGTVFIEIGSDQKTALETLLKGSPWRFEFWKDQYERWRVVTLTHH